MKKSYFLIICIFSLLFFSCTDKQTKIELQKHADASLMQKYIVEQQKKQDSAITDFITSLSAEEKLSQIFIENLEGNTKFRSYETYNAIAGNGNDTPIVAGGYLFFSFNIAETREQQIAFMQSITDYCKQYNVILPFLAVDQEGGWVNRLKKLNTKLPDQETVAKNYDISGAQELYANQAEQMKELGFHMNLAPVMEICTDDNKDFLDGRSFGNIEQTKTYGRACINGYENNGVGTVIKHFPGNTNTDPHTGLPEIKLSQTELEVSIEPFIDVIDLNPAGILMSHARTSAIDSEHPACLSEVWVTELLRNKYNYQGIIFSDDIFMGALADNGYPPEKAVVMAIDAGIDCIMISEKRIAKPVRILYKKMQEDDVFAAKIDKAVERIIKYKLSIDLLHFEIDSNGNYKVVL